MREWISVNERLPEQNKRILAAFESGEVTVTVYTNDPDTGELGLLFEDVYGKVTHWQPMPKHPNENKEEKSHE